jgi:Cu(I)/Ag(I) efflux system membrane protein CusA/SilA
MKTTDRGDDVVSLIISVSAASGGADSGAHAAAGVLLAFIPMYYQGLTINIMSLGGIAIAIGAMVDASIIIIENIHKKLETWEHEGKPGNRLDVIVSAMQEVGPSIFFSLLVITVAFMPVFTLEATEGRLFKPLALQDLLDGIGGDPGRDLTPALAAAIRGKIRARRRTRPRWLIARAGGSLRSALSRTVVALSVPTALHGSCAALVEERVHAAAQRGTLLYMRRRHPARASASEQVPQSMDRQS